MVNKSRLVAVLALNMAQGMPASFFAIGLPALLRESGATLDVVAMSYLVWTPWAFKWLWGASIDSGRSLIGRLGQTIVWLPPLIASCFLLLLPFPPSLAVWPVFAVGITCSFLSATLQMSLSRWIVLTENDERQRAILNSVQVAGMTAGAMTGGALVVFLATWVTWSVAVIAISLLVAATSLPYLLTHQRASVQRETHTTTHAVSARWPGMFAVFDRAGVGRLLVLMLFSDLATGADILLPALLVDVGYDASTVTLLLSTLAMFIIVSSSFVTGAILHVLGADRMLFLLLALKAAVMMLLATRPVEGAPFVAGLAILSMVVTAIMAIAYLQIYMRVALPGAAASDIAILTSIRAIYLMIGAIGGGYLASRASYAEMFWAGALLSLAATVIVMLKPVSARRTGHVS